MEPKFIEYCKENNYEASLDNYNCWLHGYGFGRFRLLKKLLEWAKERKKDETEFRPDVNIYKKTLVQTWDQVIRKFNHGGNQVG